MNLLWVYIKLAGTQRFYLWVYLTLIWTVRFVLLLCVWWRRLCDYLLYQCGVRPGLLFPSVLPVWRDGALAHIGVKSQDMRRDVRALPCFSNSCSVRFPDCALMHNQKYSLSKKNNKVKKTIEASVNQCLQIRWTASEEMTKEKAPYHEMQILQWMCDSFQKLPCKLTS